MSGPFIIAALLAALFALGFSIGSRRAFARGRDHGRHEGWLEHYDECVARDRARRQRNGQFKDKVKP